MPSKGKQATDADETRARAEARFKKREQAEREGEKVWAERAAAGRAADEQRARLKSLRLAKEAADRDAEAQKKAARPAKKPTRG